MKTGWLMAALLLAGCSDSTTDRTYTLYRNSPVDSAMRIHIASFDADEKAEYNQENCNIASALWQKSVGNPEQVAAGRAAVRYWCEKGRFKR